MRRIVRVPVGCMVLMLFVARGLRAQPSPLAPDDRHGIVATDTSGWGGSHAPLQGPAYFDAIGMKWWYNYLPQTEAGKVWSGYPRLYMYWKATMAHSAEQIQSVAAAAAAAYPGETIWWALSNEPNDRAQANQSAAGFAAIYYHFHRNLKAGDPNCRIMGGGILNWDFLSDSVWQRGKDWYEEFRQAWYDHPEYRSYSETNYCVSFPPQDAFNLHTYDLRGVQGTPYEPEDWRYSRDQILRCYADLLGYPEVLDKRIWLTEFGALRSATMADNIALTRQLVGWMRNQPFMTRWFWFTIHSDKHWSDIDPPRLELLTETGKPTALGQAALELASLPLETRLDPLNDHYESDPIVAYSRSGFGGTDNIVDVVGDHPRFELLQNGLMADGTMKGRLVTAAPGRLVCKMAGRFRTNYDAAKVCLVVDAVTTTGKTRTVWKNTVSGSSSGDVEFGFHATDRIRSVGIGLVVREPFTCSHQSSEWFGELRNLILYTEPDRGLVSPDEDLDGDVDRSDFSHFLACFTGTGLVQDDPACVRSLLDDDGDVDLDDFAVFQWCLSGDGNAADPECAN